MKSPENKSHTVHKTPNAASPTKKPKLKGGKYIDGGLKCHKKRTAGI